MKKIVILTLVLIVLTSIQASAANTYPQKSHLNWKGQDLFIWKGTSQPGPNTWSQNNVWIDDQDRLHLTIKYINGKWQASGIDVINKVKYGNITWTLDSPVQNLDKNCVLGLFTYVDDYHEQDIEFSRWGNIRNDLLSFSCQPNMIGAFSVKTQPKTCQISWREGKTVFSVWDASGKLIGQSIATKNVPVIESPICMNLWLTKARSPANRQTVEVIISDLKIE